MIKTNLSAHIINKYSIQAIKLVKNNDISLHIKYKSMYETVTEDVFKLSFDRDDLQFQAIICHQTVTRSRFAFIQFDWIELFVI